MSGLIKSVGRRKPGALRSKAIARRAIPLRWIAVSLLIVEAGVWARRERWIVISISHRIVLIVGHLFSPPHRAN